MSRKVTLIVEDGTIVADANSFVTEEQIVNYAVMRGVTIPYTTDEDKDAVAVLGISAMDYLRFMPWRGEPVDPDQTTPFPRKNMGISYPEDKVPPAVVDAQLQLTLLVNAGVELINNSSGTGFLIKEKIGPIENQYSEKVGVSTTGFSILPGIQALLEPWLIPDLDGIVPVMIRSVGGRCGC